MWAARLSVLLQFWFWGGKVISDSVYYVTEMLGGLWFVDPDYSSPVIKDLSTDPQEGKQLALLLVKLNGDCT